MFVCILFTHSTLGGSTTASPLEERERKREREGREIKINEIRKEGRKYLSEISKTLRAKSFVLLL